MAPAVEEHKNVWRGSKLTFSPSFFFAESEIQGDDDDPCSLAIMDKLNDSEMPFLRLKQWASSHEWRSEMMTISEEKKSTRGRKDPF